MISQTSTTLQPPAYAWPLASVRVEGFSRIFVNVSKCNRHLAQGCFPMTD